MDIFEILDRESERFECDFRRCAAAAAGEERKRLGHALVQRVAAYLLALENELYPALTGLDEQVLGPLQDDHGRLKWRVADALLGYCGAEAKAYRLLCKAHRQLHGHVLRLRQELYPLVYKSIPEGVQSLIADAILHWLETNRRHVVAAAVPAQTEQPITLPRATPPIAPPPRLDLSRIPTLHQVVAVPMPAQVASHTR